MLILVINPGSTSTKIAVYDGYTPVLVKSIKHKTQDLEHFAKATDQYEFRKRIIIDEIKNNDIPFKFDAVIGRGGLTKPLSGGVYEVNEKMMHDTCNAEHQHACDLGCLIAHEIASEIPGCRSFIADPVVTDELNDYARVCGSPLMQRSSIWHALNQRAMARRFAREHNTSYEDVNLIVCHLGGGISIAAHEHGKAVDVNNALDGEGPFSPERAGTLPAVDLVRLCYSGRFTEQELLQRIAGNAGLTALLGTNDMMEVDQRIKNGDEKARFYVDAMAYHIAKNITAQAAVLCGKIDAIILTGGMARWDYLVEHIMKRVSWLAPTHIYPGENELEALAHNAIAVLKGKISPKTYE